MPTGFVLTLTSAVSVVVAARFLIFGLPLREHAISLTLTEVALTLIGLATLALHCGAMFFTDAAGLLPASAGAIKDIRALGTASLVWYVVPALLVLSGLRRLPRLALAATAAALLAIGVTMYDGGSLDLHLSAIFVGVVLLAATPVALVRGTTRASITHG